MTLVSSLAFVFAGVASQAGAAVLFAGADYYEDGALTNSNSSTGSPATTGAGGDHGGSNAYAAQNGILLVSASAGQSGGVAMMMMAFPSPDGASASSSTAVWEDTITNNSGSQLAYRYLFYVDRISVSTGGEEGDYAGVAIDITLDGASIWAGYAEMDGCSLDYTANFGSASTFGCSASWFPFTIGLDLGTYVNGDSFTLRYEMTAFANSADNNAYNRAGLGDPFDPHTTGVEIITRRVSTDVPAPGALGLLAVGLVGVAVRRRKAA